MPKYDVLYDGALICPQPTQLDSDDSATVNTGSHATQEQCDVHVTHGQCTTLSNDIIAAEVRLLLPLNQSVGAEAVAV